MAKFHPNRFMIAAALIASNYVYITADNQIPDSPDAQKEIDLKKDNPGMPSRPRVPSNQSIHLVYNLESQECHFKLPDGIEFVSVEVTDKATGFIFYGEAYACYPICSIPLENGNYTIFCTTDDGSVFSGTLSI